MNLSWSQKLFLKVNSFVGKNKVCDGFFYFIANVLIYVLGLVVLWWGIATLDSNTFKLFIKLLLTACFFGFIDNYFIALFWRHPRPIIQFPQIKILFNPLENWKAFPSDHTTISFIFVFITLFFQPVWWLAILFIFLASLIGVSRIYCGVHYPRDIVGGIGFAFFYTILSFWLLEYVSQPVYVWFINLIK